MFPQDHYNVNFQLSLNNSFFLKELIGNWIKMYVKRC